MTRTRKGTLVTVLMVLALVTLPSCGYEGNYPQDPSMEAGGVLGDNPIMDESGVTLVPQQVDELGIITHMNPVPDSYIVQFKDEMVGEGDVSAILSPTMARFMANMVVEENALTTVQVGHVFQAGIKGFTAKMSREEAGILAKDPRVLIVEQDAYVHAEGTQTSAPWHLDRIDQQSLPLNNTFVYPDSANQVHIYVLDLGALCTHNQFAGKMQTGAANSPNIQGAASTCIKGTSVFNTGVSVAASTNYTPSPATIVGTNGTGVVVKITAATGDADLYVKKGAAPTTTVYDCRPYTSSSTETCDLSGNGAGTYYIMVRGYNAVTGLSVERYDACATMTTPTYGDACAAGLSGAHGTHVMGLAGGSISGVAKGTNYKLHTVRTMPNDGYGVLSDQVAGFTWVTANKISPAVINFSIGEDAVYATEDNAITAAVNAGIFVAVAAGNSSEDAALSSPGSCVDAFVVGASNKSDQFNAEYSNFGAAVDIVAPGGDGQGGVISCLNTGNDATGSMFGTSMASPMVAGVAAVLRAQNPTWTVAQVKTALLTNAISDKLTLVPAGTVNKLLQIGTVAPACPDGTCNGTETCSTCAADCGQCCTVTTLNEIDVDAALNGSISRCVTATSPVVTLTGINGNADLWVKKGAAPTTTVYDCRGIAAGSNETCTMTGGAGVYYILIKATSAFTGVALHAGPACTKNCTGRTCGPDPVCGQSCGTCNSPQYCGPAFSCICEPDCAASNCGSDGCGGVCGTCVTPQVCDATGMCSTPSQVCNSFTYTTDNARGADITYSGTKKYSVRLDAYMTYTFGICTGDDTAMRLYLGSVQKAYNDDYAGCGGGYGSKIIYTPTADGLFDVYVGCGLGGICGGTLSITPAPGCPFTGGASRVR